MSLNYTHEEAELYKKEGCRCQRKIIKARSTYLLSLFQRVEWQLPGTKGWDKWEMIARVLTFSYKVNKFRASKVQHGTTVNIVSSKVSMTVELQCSYHNNNMVIM